MRETPPLAETLALEALLYATGELDAPAAIAFEQRLEEEPAAQEALCQAVRLTLALGGSGRERPDPAYRQRVRQRLRTPARRRGAGASWRTAAAAAAVLLAAGSGLAIWWSSFREPQAAVPAVAESPRVELPGPIHDLDLSEAELSQRWAELSRQAHQRLEQAHRELLTKPRTPAEQDSARARAAGLWAGMNEAEHMARTRQEIRRRAADRRHDGSSRLLRKATRSDE